MLEYALSTIESSTLEWIHNKIDILINVDTNLPFRLQLLGTMPYCLSCHLYQHALQCLHMHALLVGLVLPGYHHQLCQQAQGLLVCHCCRLIADPLALLLAAALAGQHNGM